MAVRAQACERGLLCSSVNVIYLERAYIRKTTACATIPAVARGDQRLLAVGGSETSICSCLQPPKEDLLSCFDKGFCELQSFTRQVLRPGRGIQVQERGADSAV